MTKLHQRVHVDCPPLQAETRLVRYLRLRGDAARVTQIHLRLPILDYGVHGALALDRNAVATIRRTVDNTRLNTIFEIDWKPEGGGPFPTFKGVLMTWSDAADGTCYLDLDGAYDPPQGVAGAAFDVALGHRIAGATARQLLDELKTGIEPADSDAELPP